jgi:hypothetical protein
MKGYFKFEIEKIKFVRKFKMIVYAIMSYI